MSEVCSISRRSAAKRLPEVTAEADRTSAARSARTNAISKVASLSFAREWHFDLKVELILPPLGREENLEVTPAEIVEPRCRRHPQTSAIAASLCLAW
jgi:hypothetical protein